MAPGQLWYWVGANQPGRIWSISSTPQIPPTAQGAGDRRRRLRIDKSTSVSLVVQSVQLEDERLTYSKAPSGRSIGRALVEVAAARATTKAEWRCVRSC